MYSDNIIYTSRYNDLVAFDATSLKEIKAVSIIGNPWGFLYGGRVACAPHNSSIAAMTGEETRIFPDSKLVNPIIIPKVSGDINVRLSALTSDDRFFVVQGDSKNCQVFNAKNGTKIFDFQFTYTTIYDIHSLITVSENGRYFCASSENGMEVFEINGTIAKRLYTDTRQYMNAIFIPSQPDQLLLRVDSDIEIRQVPDFNLIQKFDVAEKDILICNIDPATGNLLYHQNDSLMVAKINNITEPIIKLKSDETTCKLLNNKLLTYGKDGIALDISPYINHPE